MKKKLQVTQTRSAQGRIPTQRETLRGLGLKGVRTSVTVANTPAFRGAIKKVLHLVEVQERD